MMTHVVLSYGWSEERVNGEEGAKICDDCTLHFYRFHAESPMDAVDVERGLRGARSVTQHQFSLPSNVQRAVTFAMYVVVVAKVFLPFSCVA